MSLEKIETGLNTFVSANTPIKKKFFSGIAVESIWLILFYALIILFFSTTTKEFFSFSNALNILDNVAVLGIVSIGQAFAIISGGFDLSVGGVVPLGAVLYATITNAGVNIPLAILIVVLIGGAVGLINGLVITKLGINPLITTLGTLSIAGGMAKVITGGLTTTLNNPDASVLANSSFGGISYYVWVMIILSLLGFVTLRYTVFGRSLYSIGGNREASRLAGIQVNLVTNTVYMICGALAALAGIVIASQLMAGSGTMGIDTNLTSITAVILGGGSLAGGAGGIIGTFVGVLIMGTLANGMALMQVQAFYQEIATGLVLLLAVGFSGLRGYSLRKRR